MFGPAPFILTFAEGAVNLALWIVSFWRFAAFIIFLLLGGVGLAWGADLKDVAKAVAVAKAKSNVIPTVIGEGSDAVPAKVWAYHEPKCGDRVGITVVEFTLSPTQTVTSIHALTGFTASAGQITVVVMDIDGNGTVDSVADNAISVATAQPMYDTIVRCIARQ